MLKTKISDTGLNWLENILDERFGGKWNIFYRKDCLHLKLQNSEGSIVFDSLEECFITIGSKNSIPSSSYHFHQKSLKPYLYDSIPMPGLKSFNAKLIDKKDNYCLVKYDILGLVYWILSRIEEINENNLDEHERFRVESSHAYKNNYLNRPIIDEWLQVLGQIILKQWPQFKLKVNVFNINPTHDIDRPFKYYFNSGRTMSRQFLGDLLKRNSIELAKQRFTKWIKIKSGKIKLDPFNTFDWIMDQSESINSKSTFYFLAGKTSKKFDSNYKIHNNRIREILKKINDRGHKIGLHPSYHTFKNVTTMKKELNRLIDACSKEKIYQDNWEVRMHYLRWNHPITLRILNDIGFSYDSSLGFPAQVGFRCGTAFSYPAFDPILKEKMRMRIRPLIAMDTTVLSKNYMNLDYSSIFKSFNDLHSKCKSVGGSFNFLWHNSELYNDSLKKLYSNILNL